MLNILIPADLSDFSNARVAAERIEGLVNVALREQVSNLLNMGVQPLAGAPKISITIGPAVPTAEGIDQVIITASATFEYTPLSKF